MTDRICVNCGRTVPAEHPRHEPWPACVDKDDYSACTFDVTPHEAFEVWRARYYETRAEIERLRNDLKETSDFLAACRDFEAQATKEWQKAHPQFVLTWPDARQKLHWLLDRHKADQEEIERLREALTTARAAALKEAAQRAREFADANYAAKPFTSYVEGRADAGAAIAAHIDDLTEAGDD